MNKNSRRLRFENLENREVLSVSTFAALAPAAECLPSSNEVAVVEISSAVAESELPSTVVTTLDDVVDPTDGKISIREAISYAESNFVADPNTADSIVTFDSSISGGTILLNGAELEINQFISIDGGDGGITIDANHASRVLSVYAGDADAPWERVSIGNVTFQNGYTLDDGGAIYNAGNLSIYACTVQNNIGNWGGGIESVGVGLLISDCVIVNNTAIMGGGGVDSFGEMTDSTPSWFNHLEIHDTVIAGNSCGGSGGGIYNAGRCYMTNVEISENSAGQGGGIYNDFESSVEAHTLKLLNNESYNSAGGIYNDGGLIDIEKSVISGNTSGVFAGGIWNREQGDMTIYDSVIADNSASVMGGGVMTRDSVATLVNCTIADNSASYGGGLLQDSRDDAVETTTTVKNTIIAENQANEGGNVCRAEGAEGSLITGYNNLSDYTEWNGEDNYLYDANQPLFTDSANGDYSLAKSSQAVDKGNDDFLKQSFGGHFDGRVQGARVDIGAYEAESKDVVLSKYNASSNQAIIEWDDVADATGYQVMISRDGGEFVLHANKVTKPSIAVNNVYVGGSYAFKVYAWRANGKLVSDGAAGTIEPIKVEQPSAYNLSTPINLTIQAANSDNVVVRWYQLTASGRVEIAEAFNQTSYQPTNADYELQVEVSGVNESAGFVSTVNIARPDLEANVSNLVGSTATLSWTELPGAAKYSIKRSVDGGATWVTYRNNVVDTSEDVKGLYKGKTYLFKVVGYDANGKEMRSISTCNVDRSVAANAIVDEAFAEFFAENFVEF